jgi:hypothetical protein
MLQVELQVQLPMLKQNSAVARQHAQEKKYPLWKYVMRQQGPGAKLVGEGMFFGHVISETFSRTPTTKLRAICWPLIVD